MLHLSWKVWKEEEAHPRSSAVFILLPFVKIRALVCVLSVRYIFFERFPSKSECIHFGIFSWVFFSHSALKLQYYKYPCNISACRLIYLLISASVCFPIKNNIAKSVKIKDILLRIRLCLFTPIPVFSSSDFADRWFAQHLKIWDVNWTVAGLNPTRTDKTMQFLGT